MIVDEIWKLTNVVRVRLAPRSSHSQRQTTFPDNVCSYSHENSWVTTLIHFSGDVIFWGPKNEFTIHQFENKVLEHSNHQTVVMSRDTQFWRRVHPCFRICVDLQSLIPWTRKYTYCMNYSNPTCTCNTPNDERSTMGVSPYVSVTNRLTSGHGVDLYMTGGRGWTSRTLYLKHWVQLPRLSSSTQGRDSGGTLGVCEDFVLHPTWLNALKTLSWSRVVT
jgi:hypothetical protein